MELDLLGAPYRRRTIELEPDAEGPVTATLVWRHAERPGGTAVLYVHGFNDYFFQTHLADFYVERGLHFYALDLRKYGRSLLAHQTPNFCTDLTEYYPELDEAVRIIREEHGHDRLLVNAHSTGGLITPLWAHDRQEAGLVDGMFLNSPFFDLNVPALMRRVGTPVTTRAALRYPYRALPLGVHDAYGASLHHSRNGEWDFDLAWKPLAGFPIRLGWLRAIRLGQHRLHRGLDIAAPVLVAASTRSYKRARWTEAAQRADSVLDVAHMVKWAPRVGPATTVVRVADGLHDLTLSVEASRKDLFIALDGWLRDQQFIR